MILKNIPYYFAIFFLTFCFITIPISYFFCIDKTKYSNTQLLPIALTDPGTTICLYKNIVRKDLTQNKIKQWIFGSEEIVDFSMQARLENNQLDQKQVCRYFIFGTDKYGRDVYSRIIIGLRYTLIVAIFAVMTSLFIGILLGSLSAYLGGRWDQIISIGISIFWSIPTLLLAFAILFTLGRSITSIFIAIALTMWSDIARLVRGQVLYYKELNFIKSGQALGYSDSRILFRHILPNIMNPLWIASASNFALAVLLESGLSFLGLGLAPPIPSLGNVLQEQYPYAIADKPLLAIIPSIVLVLLILSFQIITNQLRDRYDVRM